MRDHTLTILSHPPETMMGLEGTGENRTQLTHSWCPSCSWMVYLHSPSVFQSLMLLSRDPLTIWRLSTEKATLSTSLECPMNRRVVFPVLRSHSRSVPSHDLGFRGPRQSPAPAPPRGSPRRSFWAHPESANCPSDEMTTSCTKWACPCSERSG